MLYKKPKNDHKYEWTNHVVGKMAHYGISESLIKRVVRFPKRVEEGIAPGTTACMSPYGTPTKDKRQPYRGEVWVMYVAMGRKSTIGNKQLAISHQQKKRIITTWRYPGVSRAGASIPIPDEILAEIENL
ncbi:MAG: hypothetical protein Q7S32_00995 [bacterium]|nr:hypothetical protein [bacterium]